MTLSNGKHFRKDGELLLVLFLLFGIAELLVDPTPDFPLNDDWSYAKSIKRLFEFGEINIGNWCAMTLATHLIWGGLFVKVFGFSFTILRLSTLVSSLIGLTTLYFLVKRVSGSSRTGFTAAVVLMFNPLYFNLSNTYMTDVNFNTLLVLFLNFVDVMYRRNQLLYYIPIFITAVMLLLLRQFGLVAPAALLIASFFSREKRFKHILFSAGIVLSAYAALKLYEHYLRGYLAPWSPYQFSGKYDPLNPEIYKVVYFHLSTRFADLLAHLLVYLSPFAAFFLWPLIKQSQRIVVLISLVLSASFVYIFVFRASFPLPNVFTNMVLGPETFYQSWKDPVPHNHSETFGAITECLKYLFSFVSFLFLFLSFFHGFRGAASVGPLPVFVLSFIVCYIFLIGLSDFFFDRYLLPLTTLLMVASCRPIAGTEPELLSPGILPLLVCVYVSVAGTKDYFAMNSSRWKAYEDIRNTGVPTSKINGGFEINCWNEGEYNWWYDFVKLDKFDYVIQFRPEPGFRLIRRYPFRRYFPPIRDTINVFARNFRSQQSQP